ncbi:hypothetical protein [Methylorubrum sp. SB2]|uniref:hypothetical protein n=1 Tax=Methylorubrum subtropicum TaxID=3138812 RepID=UPI00313D03C2
MTIVVHASEMAALRKCMSSLDRSAAWADEAAPSPEQIYTPWSHGRALDPDRTLVVGNRGVGKSFWSSALVDPTARAVAADAYPRSGLNYVSKAVFGFRAGIADEIAPDKVVLKRIVNSGVSPESIWLAVALRALTSDSGASREQSLLDLAMQAESSPEISRLKLRSAAESYSSAGEKFLLIFDALDRLGDNWSEIQDLTEGLFKFALSVRGLRGLALKIFVRPDQLADPRLSRFPDASKLQAERVDLRWRPHDLFGLLFFYLMNDPDSQDIMLRLVESRGMQIRDGVRIEWNAEWAQQSLFSVIAGEWMGANKKRGSTYSWLPLHLADAREECSPRSFLKALSVAASYEPAPTDLAIDHHGIKEGVVEASKLRLAELSEDYWWINMAMEPLRGISVPCLQSDLIEVWRVSHTVESIRTASESTQLLPLLFESFGSSSRSDETSLMLMLYEIAVLEIRSNGKANFPDIFRIAAGIKRRGGVKPPNFQH